MRARLIMAALLVGSPLVDGKPADAVDLHKSRLSVIELSKCRQLKKHKDGGSWICPGLRGYPVYFAEGDLRQMIGFGPRPEHRRSATQTLAPFNTLFDGKRRPTIEWRVERMPNGRDVPFATIVRFHTSVDGQTSGDNRGDILVITKVDARDSCHLAVIDARATPDAMAMARTWAIAEAKKRTCPDKPEVIGTPGSGPM